MRTPYKALLIAIALMFSQLGHADWTHATDSVAGYSVVTPFTPRQFVVDEGNGVVSRRLEAINEDGAIGFGISYFEAKANPIGTTDPVAVSSFLEVGARELVQQSGGLKAKITDIFLGPWPGKEIEFQVAVGLRVTRFVRWRTYQVDNKLFQLSAVGTNAPVPPDMANLFFESFKLIEKQ